MSVCRQPGCTERVSRPERYCEAHRWTDEQRREQNRQRYRHYDRYRRNRDAKRFYSSAAWLKAREAALIRDNGLCQRCLRKNIITPANTVHHKEPLRSNWDRALDLENLESLCEPCHGTVEAEERGQRAKGSTKSRRVPTVESSVNPERF